MKYAFLAFTFIMQITGSAQLLIKNVNVLDVENKKILNGYDVLVMDGKITVYIMTRCINCLRVLVIDGTRKWLAPGFTQRSCAFSDGWFVHSPTVMIFGNTSPR
jgi:hypothetical protein